jgi:hypothetical protein
MNSNTAALIVPPAGPASATNDIRGLKPPVDLPNTWAWAGWVLALLVLGTLAAWAWHRWRKRAARPPLVPAIPPHIRARQKLQHALSLLSDPRQFCILVSDTIRVYLEERFQFRAPERTTEEFLAELQETDLLSPDQKQSLGQFLQSCDLVKFARFEPTEATLRELHDSALRLIDETQFDEIEPGAPGAGPPSHPSVSEASAGKPKSQHPENAPVT